jgi:ABC-2 type transport system permease protein
MALKDVKLLCRDRGALVWVLGFPLVMAVLFGAIFGGMGGDGFSKMSVALIDRDQSELSRSFVAELRKSSALNAYDSGFTQARDAVRTGKTVAFVVLPKGFGESSLWSGSRGPDLETGIDPSRKAEAAYLQGLLAQAYFACMSEQMRDPAKMHKQVARARAQISPLGAVASGQQQDVLALLSAIDRYYSSGAAPVAGGGEMRGPNIKSTPVFWQQNLPKSAYEISFPQAIIWALIGAITTFSISLVRERTRGTLLRLKAAPISLSQILAGKGLACFLTCAGVMALLLSLGAAAFHIRFVSPLTLAAALCCTAFSFVGLMMLLSVLGKTEESVGSAGWGIMMILSMFGGGMVPMIAMPKWMLSLSVFSPIRWAILALEGAIWRGFSPQEMLQPCLVLLGVGLATFYAGTRVLRATAG